MLSLLRGLHDAAPTVIRATLAEIELLEFRVVLARPLVLVVVGELGSRVDAAQRVDEDLFSGDNRFAIRIAGMVDEACIPSAGRDRAVDYRFLVEGEEKGVMSLHTGVVVAPVGFAIADPLTGVLYDARSRADVTRRENAAAVDRRIANYVQRLAPVS